MASAAAAAGGNRDGGEAGRSTENVRSGGAGLLLCTAAISIAAAAAIAAMPSTSPCAWAERAAVPHAGGRCGFGTCAAGPPPPQPPPVCTNSAGAAFPINQPPQDPPAASAGAAADGNNGPAPAESKPVASATPALAGSGASAAGRRETRYWRRNRHASRRGRAEPPVLPQPLGRTPLLLARLPPLVLCLPPEYLLPLPAGAACLALTSVALGTLFPLGLLARLLRRRRPPLCFHFAPRPLARLPRCALLPPTRLELFRLNPAAHLRISLRSGARVLLRLPAELGRLAQPSLLRVPHCVQPPPPIRLLRLPAPPLLRLPRRQLPRTALSFAVFPYGDLARTPRLLLDPPLLVAPQNLHVERCTVEQRAAAYGSASPYARRAVGMIEQIAAALKLRLHLAARLQHLLQLRRLSRGIKRRKSCRRGVRLRQSTGRLWRGWHLLASERKRLT
eukprot:scaffold1761_cov108-Isochrysis_galbana.AAC.1